MPNSSEKTQELKRHYTDFIEASREWLPVLYISRRKNSPEWFSFLRQLASSASAFYAFHRSLYKEHLNTKSDHPDESNKVRVYNFYADLVISKLKKAIFTENPRNPIRDIYADSFEDLKDVFKHLAENLVQGAKPEGSRLLYFYLKAFCYFDVIFSKTKPEAFFCRFQPHHDVKEKFVRELKEIKKSFDDLNNELINTSDYGCIIEKSNKFKNKTLFLPRQNIKDSVNAYKDKPYFNDGHKTPEEIYDKLFPPVFDPEVFALDPLCRFYSNVVRKCMKIVECSLKYTSAETNARFIKERLGIEFGNYLTKLIDILTSQDYGDNTGELLKKLLENDHNFIGGFIIKEILQYGSRRHSLPNNKGTERPDGTKQEPTQQKIEPKEDYELKTIALERVFDPKKINDIHGPWKFENLIIDHKTSMHEIELLIKRIAFTVPNEWSKCPIIGVERAGSFIAYLYDLVVNGGSSTIRHFKTTPFISLMPWSLPLTDDNDLTVFRPLIFDESYKSGFTSKIIEEYLRRKKTIADVEPCIFSLMNIVDYPKTHKPNNLYYVYSWSQIFEETRSMDSVFVSRPECDGRRLFDLSDCLRSITTINCVSDCLKMIEIGEERRYDIIRLFTSPRLFFAVSKFFCEEFAKRASNDKELQLIYGSDYAYLVALAIVLLFKNNGDKFKISVLHKLLVKKNDSYKVFLDIEIFTGDTICNSIGPDITDVAQALNRYDMVCCIVNHNQKVADTAKEKLLTLIQRTT